MESSTKAPSQKCEFCAHCPWIHFFGLPVNGESLALFQKGCTAVRLEREETRYLLGDEQKGLELVQEGLLQATSGTPGGRAVVVDLLEPGDLHGLPEYFGLPVRRSRLSAVVPTTLCHLSQSLIERLRSAYGSRIDGRLLAAMARRSQRLEHRLRTLALLDVKERLAVYLLERFRTNGSRDANGTPVVQLPAAQSVVAAYLATSREEISRTLGYFRDRKLIEKQNGSIRILDPAGLRKEGTCTCEELANGPLNRCSACPTG